MKTIVITGASSGIGNALAKHLASLKYNVIATARNKVALEELQASSPTHIKIVVGDITTRKIHLEIKEALANSEQPIILVHNAGIAIPQLFSEMTEELWDQHYLINTRSPIFLTKLLLPYLKNGGRVLNISTGLAHTPMGAMSAYGVSKAALFFWKEFCNIELKNQGISFGSVMPGIVNTDMQARIRASDSEKFPNVDLFKGFYQRHELLSPQIVAKFLTWLILQADDEAFMKGDWNVYDKFHHIHWASPGEKIERS